MNWLIYIGGYLLIIAIIPRSKTEVMICGKDVSQIFYAVSILMVWIWICWKFI